MKDELTVNSSRSVSAKSSRRTGQRGNALVEYAFTITITLTLIFAIIDFGRALYTYHFISNAAREGTRYASVRGWECGVAGTYPTDCPVTKNEIRTYVKNVPAGIDMATLTVTPNFRNPNNLAVCAIRDNYPGCAVEVSVQYPFKFLFPLMPLGFTMSSTSYMVISH